MCDWVKNKLVFLVCIQCLRKTKHTIRTQNLGHFSWHTERILQRWGWLTGGARSVHLARGHAQLCSVLHVSGSLPHAALVDITVEVLHHVVHTLPEAFRSCLGANLHAPMDVVRRILPTSSIHRQLAKRDRWLQEPHRDGRFKTLNQSSKCVQMSQIAFFYIYKSEYKKTLHSCYRF